LSQRGAATDNTGTGQSLVVLRLRESYLMTRHTEQHFEAGRSEGDEVMRYAVVIEKADGNYSAYMPDLPGCIATGETVEAVEREIRAAIRFHIEGLKADGLEATSIADYVDA
jgi:predicted RNase H-like HicB family nuclease